MKRLKIGIVGCGAIGSSLAKFIKTKLRSQAELIGLYDIDPLKSRRLSRQLGGGGKLAAPGISRLIAGAGLIIEAASAKSSFDIARSSLKKGRDVMIMSAGGVVSGLKQLSILAKKHCAKVYIPSGAVSGIDALKASRIAGIKSIILTTRKNPLSFKGVKYVQGLGVKLDKIKGERVLFSGSAKEAVKYFPQNINVAAVLSLAGIGAEKTTVKIIASSRVKRNIHEIRIESGAGKVFTRTENVLHPDNPKTSFLAVLSAMQVLRQIMEPVKIGT